ncbi:hypothetical protein E1J61_16470 [Cupriavidus sp. L7L]|nr:hypothetical protein E1J61_16470 [Cupriavidus sp. L7L]
MAPSPSFFPLPLSSILNTGHCSDRWSKRLSCCDAAEMRRFAQSLRADLPAVRAAFMLPWMVSRDRYITDGSPAQVRPSVPLFICRYGEIGRRLLRQRRQQLSGLTRIHGVCPLSKGCPDLEE